jgi:hypothetical protein
LVIRVFDLKIICCVNPRQDRGPDERVAPFYVPARLSSVPVTGRWLTKVTKAINENWRKKNAQKKDRCISDVPRGLPNFG